MKFWGTVVVFIIAISSGSTWLMLKVGSQGTVPDRSSGPIEGSGTHTKSPTPPEPGQIVFPKLEEDGGKFTPNYSLVEFDAGEVAINTENITTLHFQSKGKSPLDVWLHEKSCGCIERIMADNTILLPKQKGIAKEAGGDGVLRIMWRPTAEQLKADPNGRLRVHAIFYTNDEKHRYLKVEINAKLVESKKGKS